MWPYDDIEQSKLSLVIILGVCFLLLINAWVVKFIINKHKRKTQKRIKEIQKEHRIEREYLRAQIEYCRKQSAYSNQRLTNNLGGACKELSEILYRSDMRNSDRKPYGKIMTKVLLKMNEVDAEVDEADFIQEYQYETMAVAFEKFCEEQNGSRLRIKLTAHTLNPDIKLAESYQAILLRTFLRLIKATLDHGCTDDVEIMIQQTENTLFVSYIDEKIVDPFRTFSRALQVAAEIINDPNGIELEPSGLQFRIPLNEDTLSPHQNLS